VSVQPKEAVAIAKSYVAELFADEQPSDIGLEELDFEDRSHRWRVTIGFARPWDRTTGVTDLLGRTLHRAYKVVTIADRDKRILSVKDRVLAR
jgi:hypothetical protein